MSTPSRAELLERARKLAPVMAERAPEAERLRQLPEDTLEDLRRAELFEIMAPRRFGGHELPLDVLVDAASAVGRGCGSTAWVLALLGIHNWMLGLFPEATQTEVFAKGAPVLAPAVFAPGGSLTRTDGGFRLTGRYAFGSGCRHGSFAMVSAPVEDPEATVPDLRCVLLPISDVAIEDTWHTSGMRGTGSHDLVVEDAFVPEAYTIPFLGLITGDNPGGAVHASPLYKLPLIPVLAYVATAPALGMAHGALDFFRDYMATRELRGGGVQVDRQASRIHLAEATMEVRSAEQLVRRGVEDLQRRNAEGHCFSVEERAHFRMEACYAATLCKRAVDRVTDAAGARAQFESSPLQRFQRDLHTLIGHVIFDFDATSDLYAKTLLGLDLGVPFA
jgi:3-hydroxy-9,10-secoandrosta-1,3,5(10)-triene-9,17-dione monooxygenase